MIKILNHNDIDTHEWQQLVNQSATASYFQTKECYDFYFSLSFLKPFLYGVSENGELKGLVCGYIIADGSLLKRFFSRRAIISGGILISEEISHTALSLLLQTLKEKLDKKVIYIEIRNYNDYTKFKSLFEEYDFLFQSHLNFHVLTPNSESALKNLSTTKRRDVKLSLKEGAEIIEAGNREEVAKYYDLLKLLYQTKVKTPLFPVEFFEKLVLDSYGKLFLIKYNGQIIGGSVCVGMEKSVLYEWFVCGTDGKFKNIYPSTLATWAAIKYAAENGYRYFDMMGAGKPEEGYGVREFKSKFGGELVEHGRFLCVISPLLYYIGKKTVEIVKKI